MIITMIDLNKPFKLEDFKRDHLRSYEHYVLETVVARLNYNRVQYLISHDDFYLEAIKELMPSSYKGEIVWPN